MRAIEEMHRRKLELVEFMLTRPGMFGSGRALELAYRTEFGDIAFIEERETELEAAYTEWERNGYRTCRGFTGAFETTPPFDEHATDELALTFAEIAWQMGWITLPRLLSADEWTTLHASFPLKAIRRDWTPDEVLRLAGPPSFQFGSHWRRRRAYASTDKRGGWICFEFEPKLDKPKGKRRSELLPTPEEVDLRLRSIRRTKRYFTDSIALTPFGRSLRADM